MNEKVTDETLMEDFWSTLPGVQTRRNPYLAISASKPLRIVNLRNALKMIAGYDPSYLSICKYL